MPEPSIRLLVTVGLSYGSAHLYNKKYVFHPKDVDANHSTAYDRNKFILVSGLLLSWFYNGYSMVHSLATVAVSYTILWFGVQTGQRSNACMAVWIFNALYLLSGYFFAPADSYDISWTMPQCILCLRLMGLAFDVSDGGTITTYNSNQTYPLSFGVDTPLPALPSWDQVAAYCYFPSAFLVGPQFSFSLYSRWLADPQLQDKPMTNWEETRKAQSAAMVKCLLLAFMYMFLQLTIGNQYPTSYLLTDAYMQQSFLKRCFMFLVCGKFVFVKYISVWLLNEGACISFGIAYDGEDEQGIAKFDGLSNILPWTFETATSIGQVIDSFNVNTNLWCKYYVFKRMKWAGSKDMSRAAALLFLATWHGFCSMYYVVFFWEFICVLSEQTLQRRTKQFYATYVRGNELHSLIWNIGSYLVCSATLYYAVVGFDLLTLHRSWVAYKSVYFIGHILTLLVLASDQHLHSPASSSLAGKKKH
ncbi:MBOAT-domain-containing protein [Hesseltinella vesiculosa]|uniref:Lysophospholipid acyltransferase 5 n=1 Tax=Hesseltinella vesiculosa TaxID=101127 RepID=A0A1X2GHC0_9FUNG|nr:MBOAT-domain-containing protein [Hesseltinella vesiculosa]